MNASSRHKAACPASTSVKGRVCEFVPVPAPSPAELQGLVQTIAERIGRSFERSRLITRDIENCYLAFDPSDEAPIKTLPGMLSLRYSYSVFTISVMRFTFA